MLGIRQAAAAVLVLACLPAAPIHAATAFERADSVPAAIHDIQGNGLVSSLAGTQVEVEGVVTARTLDGFFLQTPLGLDDADPETSEGLFVSTGTAPGSDAAVGNRVQATGLVEEFVPAANPHQMPVTRLRLSALVRLDGGNLLPDPVPLQEADLTADSDLDTMERFEGMRVSAQALRVVGPSQGVYDPASATASNTGVLHVVIGANPPPRREPGISMLESVAFPAGKTIPLFDANPEILRVDSGAQPGASPVDLGTRRSFRLVRGVLHYADGMYTLLPDPGGVQLFNDWSSPLGADRASDREIAVGWMNLGRLFDDRDDPSRNEPVAGSVAYERRLVKLARAICEAVQAPDIIAVTGVEGSRALDDLAAYMESGALCAMGYAAHVARGNDPQGLDIGFLVKAREVSPGVPRVTVHEMTQIGAAALLQGPASATRPLFAQPPLFLRASVSDSRGNQAGVSVLATQFRDETGLSSARPGEDGWATESDAAMAQRAQQASHVAHWIQARQVAHPDEALLVLGGFEANQFSDGRVDTVGILAGATPPPDTVWLSVASPVTRPLAVLVPAWGESERTTAITQGSQQALDHALASRALLDRHPVRLQATRFNSSRPVSDANELVTGAGFSGRDPFVVNIEVPAFSDADVSVGLYAPALQNPETEGFARVLVRNEGPDDAHDVQLELTTTLAPDAYTLDTAGWPWTCAAPLPTPGGSRITCTTAYLGLRSHQEFRIAIAPDPALDEITADFTARISGGYRDEAPANDASTATTLFRASTDLGIRVLAKPGPILPGSESYFAVAVSNPSGNPPGPVSLVATVDAASSAVRAEAGHGDVACDGGVDLGPRRSRFTCTITASLQQEVANMVFLVGNEPGDGGRVVGLQATVTSGRNDSNPADNVGSGSYVVSDDVDFTVRPIGAWPDPGKLDTDLAFNFAYEHRIPGVARQARAELIIDAPPEAVRPQDPAAQADWTCAAAVAHAGGRSRVACTAAPLLEHNALTMAGTLRIVLWPPLVPGLAHRSLGVSLAIRSDSNELTPLDNQASIVASVVQSTDQRLVIAAQQAQVVEPATANYRLTVSNSGHNPAREPRLRLDVNALLPPGDLLVNQAVNMAPVACMPTAADAGHTALSCPTPDAGELLVGVRTSAALANRDLVLSGRLENQLVEVTPADNVDSQSTAVVSVSDLCTATPTQSCGGLPLYVPGRIMVGHTRVVSHVLRNLGPSTAIAPRVTLSAGLPASRFSARLDGVDCAAAVATGLSSSQVECTPGPLAGDGQPHTVEMQMDARDLDPSANPVVAYQIALSSGSTDPDPGNNVASYGATMVKMVDLSAAIESKSSSKRDGTMDLFVFTGAQGPSTTATSRLSVLLSVPGAKSHVALSGDGWQCSRAGSPESVRYDCIRGTPIASGTRSRLVLSLKPGFLQFGQTVGVDVVHDYPATALAEDLVPGNNAASRTFVLGGRRTTSHEPRPPPRPAAAARARLRPSPEPSR